MRLVTKAILTSFIIIFSITAIGVALLYTTSPAAPNTNDNNNHEQLPTVNTTYTSFENGMDNWTANGTDLTDPPIVWSINRTTRQASSGNTSIELYLNNLNDQGKIWIQKTFPAKPDTPYHVTIFYMLGTSDYGMTTFQLITGASGQPPTKAGLTIQGSTDNGRENNTLTWLPKTYEFFTTTDNTSTLYASIGIWGTFETNRTYYLDEVEVRIQEVPQPTSPPNITGNWTMTTHARSGETTSQNVTIVQAGIYVGFMFTDNLESTTGTITDNILTEPKQPSRFIIYDCTINNFQTIVYINTDSQMTAFLPSNTIEFTKKQ